MKNIILCLILALLSCVNSQTGKLRIAGGEKATLGDFPHSVAIRNRHSTIVYCSGSLIHKRYVLTAAHCLVPDPYNPGYYDAENTVAILGRVTHDDNSTGLVVDIEEYIIHSYYNPNYNRNDIAIMKLARDIEEDYENYIQYLYLQESQIAIGTVMYAAGWGRTPTTPYSKDQLKVQVPIVQKSNCRIHGAFFDPEMICAGEGNGKDTCEGDSGSSLVYKNESISTRWIGVGLTSFGGAICGGAGVLGTYTNISNYISWIKNNIPDWTQPLEPIPTPCTINPTSFKPSHKPTKEPKPSYIQDISFLAIVRKIINYLVYGFSR